MIVGRVLEAEPPTRLVITFAKPGDEPPGGPSVVTFLVEPHDGIVRLTVTHENLPDQAMLSGISHGWPAVMANLKSLLETGEVLPRVWEMPRPLAAHDTTIRLRRHQFLTARAVARHMVKTWAPNGSVNRRLGRRSTERGTEGNER